MPTRRTPKAPTSTPCRRGSRRSTPGTGSSASRRRCRTCTSTARERSPSSRAARRSASRWRRRWSPCPTCCCSTSRPTTSTSTRSPGSRSCSSASRAASWSSPTTAPSSTPSRRASSSSIAACCAAIPATSPPTRRGRKSSSRPRRWPTRAPTSCWRRKRSGSARASRRGARAASAASSGCEALRAQRAARRESLGQVRLEADAGIPSGKIVAELKHVSLRFPAPAGRPASESRSSSSDFSATILRGDKVGLIGPNGAGKTTLLKLILGELQPTSGSVRQGTRLEVAYFDQMRSALDLDATLADTISPGSEWVETAGGRKHVMSYLADFLFSPERANSPLRTLSGGERNRVLLARLLALAGQRAGARRADQRPRHRHPRAARGAAAELRRHRVPRQPRPALPRQRRHQHDRLGRRRRAGALARVRRRLRGLEAAARTGVGAARGGRAQGRGRGERQAHRFACRRCRADHRRRQAGRRQADASSATRSSASSTACRRGSRRSSASRRISPRFSPAPSSMPRIRPRAEAAQMRYAQIDDELLAALERWEALGAPS